jgi:SAM-dependent methyltransferase
MKHYTTQAMSQIIGELQELLVTQELISFEVVNPDIATSTYAGNLISIEGKDYIYRSYKSWIDLAQLLFCRMLTPQRVSDHIVMISFKKLDNDHSFHTAKVDDMHEKYGADSALALIHKDEEPAFIYYYNQALKAVKINQRTNVLNLGINTGDEFATIQDMLPSELYETINFTGVDHSTSAIATAKERFSLNNMNFYAHDINHLDELNLDRFDLIVSIGTLQSSGINFKVFFMDLVQNYLTKNGALILGFPNCRWIDGEMVYGAKAPNYSYSEMSILIKDIYYCKKYLQQHKFRVTITGKEYLFLTATSIKK